jgi:hypothetical protein
VNAITWQQTPDRRVWRAGRGPILLTVTKLSSGMFWVEVEGPGVTERSPESRTHQAAQGWADNRAGGAA